jgi:hypothetical protein
VDTPCCEDTPLILSAILYPIVALFWIFILWVLWTIAQSLKSIDLSTEEIARSL